MQTIEQLSKWMPQGTTVFTLVRRVARTGMSREIAIVLIDREWPGHLIHPNHLVADLLGLKVGSREGVVMKGCGMDFGYDLVYRLAIALYDDPRALKQEWI